MQFNPIVTELNEKFLPVWALESAGSLLGWDLEVNLPTKGSSSRGVSMSQVALMYQRQLTELYPSLEKCSRNLPEFNEYEKGIVRVLERLKKYHTRIPPSLLEELQKSSVESTVVWREARKKSNFNIFRPHLEKLVSLKLQEADKLGYEKHPYDALLDVDEEGLTVGDVDSIFSKLVPALKKILAKMSTDSKYPSGHPLQDVRYDVESMTRVNRKVTELLGMQTDRFRMDISTHPFMTSMAMNDVRITTRYEGSDFRKSMYSTIHESGHAIYELQLNEGLEYTPIGIAASTGFHESQSRFWENFVGRSREFAHLVTPLLKENLDFLTEYGPEELYRYFNLVSPGMIRVDADELTYNFHIALRFDIEKRLMAEEVKVSELPSLWNDAMEDYVGVRPKNDSEGVLQDVHWSSGSIAYFPTYTLGNVIAGMIWYNIRKDIDLDDAMRKGDFASIKTWLYEKVHCWGATFAPKELARRSLGESYNPDRLIEYLERKYIE